MLFSIRKPRKLGFCESNPVMKGATLWCCVKAWLNEVHTDWHPSVPPKKQLSLKYFEAKGRIGGNERLATMRVSVGSKMPPMPVLQLM